MTVATSAGAGDESPAMSPWCPLSYLSRPSLLLEQRAGLELAQLFASPVYYGIGVPRGTGAPVLLIPGFLGSDSYMTVLSGWLRRIGYQPHYSGLTINAGRPVELIGRMLRRVDDIFNSSGRQVTVVGHSLGGVFASVLGRFRPDAVSQVVTLGSPMCEDPRRAAHPLVAALGEVLLRDPNSREVEEERALEHALMRSPLPENVGLSCVYTREDAVVRWKDCIDADPRTVAHEVRGTHSGLAWNSQVYTFLGRALPRAA
jgi:triacylglycerol lipase